MSSSAPLLNDGNGNWTRYPLHHFDWNADVLFGISNFLTLLYGKHPHRRAHVQPQTIQHLVGLFLQRGIKSHCQRL